MEDLVSVLRAAGEQTRLRLLYLLSAADLTKPSSHTRIGQQGKAEGVVIGVVTESDTGLQVLAHYMDVSSEEILASLDIYGEDLTLPQLQTLLEGLAWKFKQRFPISEGFVLKTEGKRIFVDLGVPHGVKKNMKLIKREETKLPKHKPKPLKKLSCMGM